MGYDDEQDHPYPHHRNHYDLNSKVMITAIVSLSIVILLVAVLHFYARCYLRRQSRRRTNLLDDMNFLANSSRTRSIEPTLLRTGLDPVVIASLPVFLIKKTDEMESIECPVCLSVLEEGEEARTLPNCKHTFHVECIDRWFGSHSSCPICRTEAEPRLVPEAREGVVLPTAPPLERVDSIATSVEGTSESGILQSSTKLGGSCSRLSSFRRILSKERSSRRAQSCGQEDGLIDLERQ